MLAVAMATWVQGRMRELCSGGGCLAPKTDKAIKMCFSQEKENT